MNEPAPRSLFEKEQLKRALIGFNEILVTKRAAKKNYPVCWDIIGTKSQDVNCFVWIKYVDPAR
jgi:hypothetical protein